MKFNSNKFLPHLLLSAVALILLARCKNDPEEINFLLNEQDFPSVTSMPDPRDSTKVYRILTGDTVVFKDVSIPLQQVKKRFWNLDGEEGWEATDDEFTEFVYTQPNQYLVVLCVNDEEHCAAKTILVRERPMPPPVAVVPTPPAPPKRTTPPPPPTPKPAPAPKKPTIRFTLPNVYSTNTNDTKFTINAKVGNVSRKDDLELIVNGRDYRNFNLSKGQLTATVPLNRGTNTVKLTANTPGGSESEVIEFISTPEEPLAPSLVFTQPSSSTATSQNDNFDIALATANISQKKELTLTVNGRPINDFDFSSKKGELFAKVPLKLGENTIRATATTNSGGSVSKEVTVNYRPPIVTLSKPGVAAIPSASYPASTGCIDLVRNGFSVTLSPDQDVDLKYFKVYTDDCGGAQISLIGPQLSESFRASLTKGMSQISFADVSSQLVGGKTYTLSCTPLSGYGSCGSSKTPAFHNVVNCSGVKSASTQALKVDQKGNLVLFDLQFSY